MSRERILEEIDNRMSKRLNAAKKLYNEQGKDCGDPDYDKEHEVWYELMTLREWVLRNFE